MLTTELTSVFRRQLELCRLGANETVGLLTDVGTDPRIAAATLAAAAELGSSAFELRLAHGPNVEVTGEDPLKAKPVLAALRNTDLLLTTFVGFFAPWERAIREGGGRILNVLDTPDELARLQGTPELKAAVLAARDRIAGGTVFHLSSDAGTDFTWTRDPKAEILAHYGFADEPGQMDCWGQGMAAMFPVEGSAHGRVVIQPGDIWILPYARLVNSPIELQVDDGFITKISGGGLDAQVFSYWLTSCQLSKDDKDPFAVSHLGWGMNPKARWDDAVRYEHSMAKLNAGVRSYPGNFLFSTGPGPQRSTKGHIDMPMCNCTLTVDGETIINKGTLVDPAMIVDKRRAYH
ncbi:hypothetical protein ABZ848_49170 [Streptomyces sp. NPDC047081]|uniref:hypothetical protein n=1 Tax=Streptomyces sp. NPDC047081 TaxID=3154706 RepID=UPI0033C90CBD